jgi:hypothetical protein
MPGNRAEDKTPATRKGKKKPARAPTENPPLAAVKHTSDPPLGLGGLGSPKTVIGQREAVDERRC